LSSSSAARPQSTETHRVAQAGVKRHKARAKRCAMVLCGLIRKA
jgi:hypothetical protein